VAALATGPADEDLDLRAVIGRKGYRTMTPATRVAAIAAQQALAGHWETTDRTEEAFFATGSRRGIVVASAHGNTESVCTAAELIESTGVRATSPLELPNASRNVIAATLAIRHGITGVCLTMDSGEAGGWDGLRWAARLIETGRCDEVLYVTAEAPSGAAHALTGHHLSHGAVAVLLAAGPRPAGATTQAAGPAPAAPPVTGHLATLTPGLGIATAIATGHATVLTGPTGDWQVRAR